MSYNPNNPNGQATMANSAPVVIASNQSALPLETDATIGGAGPAKATVVAGTDSANAYALRTDTSGRLLIQGVVAHDGVSAGNPNLIGAYASASAPTDVSADGDVVHLWADRAGRLQIGDGGGSLTIDGTVAATQSGTWNIGTVTTITNVVHVDDNASTLSVDDGAGSLTVDGTVGVSGTVTVDSELTTADLDTGAGTDTRAVVGLVGAKSGGGVLIPGDATKGLAVDLTNTGANATALKVDASSVAVPVTDNSGSLTVDGSVTVTQATGTNLHTVIDSGTVSTITNVVHVDDNASTLSIDDGSGSITVDGTVGVSGTVTVDSELTTADLDTGAGTDTRAVVGLAGAASGGAVLVQATTAGALKSDLTTIAGTAPTTAGKVDVKAADGDVFVRQATASNLNATVVGTGTFAVQATLAAETTKVIGTARILGNGGATLDSTVGAGTAPTNQQVVGALYNSTEISPTTGQAFALQADSKGRLRNVIMDAAGNTRGVNVNASNQMSVSVDNNPVLGAGTNAIGGITGAGTNGQIKDDTFYGDGVTSGILSVHPRVWNGTNYDRLHGDTTGMDTHVIAKTSGGATPYHLVSAGTTNATSVKGSAGTVYMITASNVNAAQRYLKLYNKATAPSVGSDTPVFTFIIPGNTAGAGTNIPIPSCGINFSTGIAFALTTEATDAGSTGVAASEIVVNLAYL